MNTFARVAAVLVPCIIAAPLIWCGRAEAQVVGRVVDEHASPVVAASVIARRDTVTIATAVTDSLGRFELAVPREEGVRLAIVHLGYQPASVSVLSADTVLTVWRRALQMQPIQAFAMRRRSPCPNRESQEARAIWERARARYSPDLHRREIRVYYLGGRSSAESIEEATSNGPPWPGRTVRIYAQPAGVDSAISVSGYAWPLSGSDVLSGDFGKQAYPRIEFPYAYHFAGDVFGQQVTLSIVDKNDAHQILAFCSKHRSRGGIQGHLVIDTGHRFQSAWWRFTGGAKESAGGDVYFEEVPAEDGALVLLPMQGSFWRQQLGTPRYEKLSQKVILWEVSAVDGEVSAPLLPEFFRARDLGQYLCGANAALSGAVCSRLSER